VLIFSYLIFVVFYLIRKSRTDGQKIILSYILIAPIFLLITEVYFTLKNKNESNNVTVNSTPQNSMQTHNYLGYSPLPGITIGKKKVIDDQVVYDVEYSINKDGFRITPNSNNLSKQCLFFFGGSFTYGEGLNVNETLPYLVASLREQKYKLFNFGFHGYGPHQMLSIIENGDKYQCESVKVIYSLIQDHIARASGLSPWDKHGPKYEVRNGVAVLQGKFSGNNILAFSPLLIQLQSRIYSALKKSSTYSFFNQRRRETNTRDLNRFIAIIDKSKSILEKRYHDLEFNIILWDSHNLSEYTHEEQVKNIIEEFEVKNYSYVLVSSILPHYKKNILEYSIHQLDRHPNKLANINIATYIVHDILK
jgi:hypothetical protein